MSEAAARAAIPGGLFSEIQRLEFKTVSHLNGALPYQRSDAILHVGHGGVDGPNARGKDRLSNWVQFNADGGVTVTRRLQDQQTTEEVSRVTVKGDVCSVLSKLASAGPKALAFELARFDGEHATEQWDEAVADEALDLNGVRLAMGTIRDRSSRDLAPDEMFTFMLALAFAVRSYPEELTAEGVLNPFADSFDDETTQTDDLPTFHRYTSGLQAALAGSEHPFIVYASCRAAAPWITENEPRNFVDAVAQATHITTFGAPGQSSVDAGLRAVAAVQRHIDAGHPLQTANPGNGMVAYNGDAPDGN